MSQFILNLNIFLNPYAGAGVGGLMALSPVELALQAKQQQLMLQYSLLNQISCGQMQLHLQMAPPALHPHLLPPLPPAPPPASSRATTVIVIDE